MNSLAKIFGSAARLKALRLFVFNREMSFTGSEVATRTNLSRDMARRELSALSDAGLIRKKGLGRVISYQLNPKFEHLEALDAFIRATTTVRPKVMVATLRRAGNLRLVALSGHFVGVIESQIDLLVVGDRLDERVLTIVVRTLEAELGREIRFAAFATEDFRYRYGVYDRLLRDVFDYPHRLLIDKIGL